MSSPCNNGGQFKCPNRKDEPVCECLYGFEGERCQKKATQPVSDIFRFCEVLCWIEVDVLVAFDPFFQPINCFK